MRRYEWTEENRLDTLIDSGGRNATKFFYDADGQRVAKLGRGGESITIGQVWALKGRRAATKHVFAGTARIAAKLLPPPGWDDVPRGPVDSTGTVVSTVGGVDIVILIHGTWAKNRRVAETVKRVVISSSGRLAVQATGTRSLPSTFQ
ncbi:MULTISPECIES: hypothetical protein [unclassified Anaeromyxobacter]|uniref:hypothetical protein n=1 Tax=unclassified Anaeromyxobacter TaxID=2620896 RepID=UPI001F56E780|nr:MULTISPECIES: hypothetical protein [unclassified Anaeromyxobacter]